MCIVLFQYQKISFSYNLIIMYIYLNLIDVSKVLYRMKKYLQTFCLVSTIY